MLALKKTDFALLSVMLLMVCCKPDKKEVEEETKVTAEVSVAPNYTSNHTTVFPTHYYKDDTLRYTINISADVDISNYTINKNGSELSTHSGSGKSVSHNLQYIVAENAGQTCNLTVKVKESSGKESTHEIASFTVIDLWEATRNSYNKQCGYANDSMIYRFRFPKPGSTTSNQVALVYSGEVVSNDPNNIYLNVVSTSGSFFVPEDLTKPFQLCFLNSADYPNFNHFNTVVPAISSYNDLSNPIEIISEFNSNYGNKITPLNYGANKVNVSQGDVFIIKSELDNQDIASITYSVVEIISIVDDNNTSDSGGNEQDYIRFKIKYFSANRF